MFVFITGTDYKLPFETYPLHQFTREHTFRDYQGYSWTEPMDLTVSVPAIDVSKIRPAINDNLGLVS